MAREEASFEELTLRVGVVHELDGDLDGALLDVLEGRIERAPLEVPVGDELGEGRRRLEERLFRYRLHAGANRTEGYAREDVAVVALARVQGFAAVRHRVEGRAAREDRSTLLAESMSFGSCFFFYISLLIGLENSLIITNNVVLILNL